MRGWRRDHAPIAPDGGPSVIAIEECSSRGTHNPTSTQTSRQHPVYAAARAEPDRPPGGAGDR